MRRNLLLTAMLAVFAVAAASAQRQVNEADGYRLLVAPDRADGSYGRGDEVRFLVSFEKDGAPVADGELTWEVTKDSWKPKTSGVARVSDGRAVIGGHKLDEPGFLQCRVKFVTPQGHELRAMAGAGVDKLLIGPSMSEPKDFMSYWKRELKKQAKIPMNIRLTPAPSTDPGIAVFDVQADCEPGSFSAYLAYPKDAKPGTLPAMVTLNGAGVKSSRAWWAVSWAKDGLCVLDFNVHGLPNGESDSYYADLENGPMFEYFLFGRDDRDSMFFHEMVMRLIRAIDVITAQPQWDGKTVMVHGCSQGGAQAVMAGCLDPRVDLVCAEIPAMCDHTGMAADRASGWPLLVECDGEGAPDARQLKAARYYDVVNFARHVTVPTYVTAGIIDSLCPPTTVYAMYNQLKGEKHMLEHPTTGHILTSQGEDFSRQAVREFVRRERDTGR